MYIIECIWISHLPCFEHIVGPSIRIDGLRDPTPWRGNMYLYHCVYKLECPPINSDSHLQAKRLLICVCFLMKKLRHLCREIQYKCFMFCYYLLFWLRHDESCWHLRDYSLSPQYLRFEDFVWIINHELTLGGRYLIPLAFEDSWWAPTHWQH